MFKWFNKVKYKKFNDLYLDTESISLIDNNVSLMRRNKIEVIEEGISQLNKRLYTLTEILGDVYEDKRTIKWQWKLSRLSTDIISVNDSRFFHSECINDDIIEYKDKVIDLIILLNREIPDNQRMMYTEVMKHISNTLPTLYTITTRLVQ